MRKIIIPAVLFAFSLSIYGQTSGSISNNIMEVPDIAPHTPEASQLLKMQEVPANGYTGTPEISIPLYTIKAGNIELPVTLTYQASGIRVNQESGLTGLGWLLNTGGIVRQQVGALDSRHVSHKNEWDRMLSEWKDTHNYGGPFEVCEGNEKGHPLWNPCGEETKDYTPEGVIYDAIHGCGEKDLFVVMLPNGKSCRYVITDIENDDVSLPYHITFVGNHPKLKICHYNDRVDVYDTDGTLYRFMVGNYREGVAMEFTLQEIVSMNNEHINVRSEDHEETGISCSDLYVLNGPPGIYTTRHPLINEERSCCPVEISTKTEKMTFFVRKIDFGTPPKAYSYLLDSIIVKNVISGKRIRKVLFHYGQFASCENGGSFVEEVPSIYKSEFAEFPDSYLSYRSQLQSLVIYGSSDNNGERYEFSYDEDNPLPLKSSFSIDQWGYYNGQAGAGMITGYPHTFIPDGSSLPINGDNEQFCEALKKGADRRCYANYVCSGTLRSITYPTGGTDRFEFEPNTFRNYYLLSPGDYSHYHQDRNCYTFCNNSIDKSHEQVEFKLPKPLTIKIRTMVLFKDYTQFQAAGSGTVIVSMADGKIWSFRLEKYHKVTGKYFERTDTIHLAAGKYKMVSILTVAKPQVESETDNISSANMEYTDINTAYLNKVNSCGGGIRVKSITAYDKDGNEVQKDVYDYNDQNGKSSGILLCPLNNIERVRIHYADEEDPERPVIPARVTYFDTKLFHSGSISTFSLEGNGVVGYRQVTKSVFHNDSLVRREVMHYSCQPAEEHQYYYHFGANLNGKLLSREIYDSKNRLVSREQNDYGIADHTGVYCNVKVIDNYVGPDHCVCITGLACTNPFMYNGRFHIIMAPSEGFHINLLRHRTSLYLANGDSTLSDKIMRYNSMYQQTFSRALTSKGTYRTDSIGYLTPSVMSNMNYSYNSLNDIDNIYTHSVTNGGAQYNLTNYYTLHDMYDPLVSTTQLQLNGTKSAQLAYQYNDSLKITEITKNSVTPDVFLWGYRCTEVVAHITGCTIDEVKSKLGESFINRISAADDFTADDDSQLRKLLPQTCRIVTFRYDPSVGIVTQTDERGRQTTYGYDDFHRLSQIRDLDGKVVNNITYHYYK